MALISELVKTMAEGDKEENTIPLPNVKSSVLTKVVDYMKYHVDNPAKEIEKPLKSAKMNEVRPVFFSPFEPRFCCCFRRADSLFAKVVSQWDADFVDVDQEVLFDLILVRLDVFFVRSALGLFSHRSVTAGLWLGCELHGHQAAFGLDLRQGGFDDQGKDP